MTTSPDRGDEAHKDGGIGGVVAGKIRMVTVGATGSCLVDHHSRQRRVCLVPITQCARRTENEPEPTFTKTNEQKIPKDSNCLRDGNRVEKRPEMV